MEEWLWYILSLLYNVVSLVLTDFWSMLDITYALDADEVAQKIQDEVSQRMQNGLDGQTLSMLQQRAQDMMSAGLEGVSSTVAEAVSARLNQMDVVSEETLKDPLTMTMSAVEESTDTVYWF